MITNGIATVMVSDMNRAVEFYTQTLGLALEYRAGDHWAQISAGKFSIGLHPAGAHPGLAGSRGAISIGLTVGESIDSVVMKLAAKGVKFDGPVKDDGAVRLAFFGDPDGNELYLCEVKSK